ncbi:MAG: hypothetical protein CMJ18_18415 [Phycisphaeraceae bacterium]|nr:hypothetical protein [Phycisphaeraceae bacterium]
MTRPAFILSALLLLVGCGGSVAVPDREALDAAVRDYLDQKTMQLKIVKYLSFEPDGDGRASAVISMTHRDEGAARVRVRFRFRFEKRNGAWRVVAHEKA